MKRLGRCARRVALAAFSALAVAACSSGAGTVQCGACPGDYLDPRGLLGPDDQVAGIRVCIDGACRTEHYREPERSSGSYYTITGVHPPNRQHIDRIEVTTYDAQQRLIRVQTGTSIDLPKAKHHDIHSCACSGFKFAYDSRDGRFVVTSQ